MAQRISRYAVYIALAFIFSYIESMISLPVYIPGVKLGLCNIVILYVLYDSSRVRDVWAVSMIRIVLVAFTFGNVMMMLYSICGAVLSTIAMLAAKKTNKFGITGVSIIGGISHNIGQIAVAAITLETAQLLYYLPILVVAGVVCGLIIGLISGICIERVKPYLKNVMSVLVCVMAGAMLSGCTYNIGTTKVEQKSDSFFAMDTYMTVTLYYNGTVNDEKAEDVLSNLRELAEHYDSLFSVTNPESDISKLNNAKGSVVNVSSETYEIISKSIDISKETDGLFDITLYPIVKAWGFTVGENDLNSGSRVPDMQVVKEILDENIGYEHISLLPDNSIKLNPGTMIDLGAVAKGYLSQKMTDYLKETDIKGAVISLGGSVQTYGMKNDSGEKYDIGIANPFKTDELTGVVRVEEKAVITSGAYQRYFEENGKKYHHIMDARTGAPVESDLASVTVIASDGAYADAIATALYVMGKDKAIEYVKAHADVGVILIDNENNTWTSEDIEYERKMDTAR